MKLGKTGGFAEGRARRGDFSMVLRGWRDFLYLRNAAPSGTIENVGCELKPVPKWRARIFCGIFLGEGSCRLEVVVLEWNCYNYLLIVEQSASHFGAIAAYILI